VDVSERVCDLPCEDVHPLHGHLVRVRSRGEEGCER
jgi:hypothetical protein